MSWKFFKRKPLFQTMWVHECTTISLGFSFPYRHSDVSNAKHTRSCSFPYRHGDTPMFGCFFSKVSCTFSPQNQSSAYKVHVEHLVLSDTWFYLINIPFEVLFYGNSTPWAKWFGVSDLHLASVFISTATCFALFLRRNSGVQGDIYIFIYLIIYIYVYIYMYIYICIYICKSYPP